MKMAERVITVPMAGIDVIRNSNGDSIKLKTILGSCVGVILTDKNKEIHGLAHIMLPVSSKKDHHVPGKYADTSIPLLLEKMELLGSSRNDLQAFVLGGASMFSFNGNNGLMNIGVRNIEAVHRILKELKIPVVYEDTGGTYGRTIIFESLTRKVFVKTLSKSILKGIVN